MSDEQKTPAAAAEATETPVVEEAQAGAPETAEAAPEAAETPAAEAKAEEKSEAKPEGDKPAPRRGGGANRGPRSGGNRGGGRGGDRGRGRGRGKGRGRGGNRPEEKEFEEELLQVRRVTRVVKGGRRLRFSATVVIGDKKGRVGFGTDKATEVPQAIQKAVRKAKKNLITVPIVDGTIPHEVVHKFKAAKIMIMPAKSGTGIIAGGAMRKIADLAGIEDIMGKSYGTTNKISTGTAMIEALALLAKEKKAADKAAPEAKEKTANKA